MKAARAYNRQKSDFNTTLTVEQVGQALRGARNGLQSLRGVYGMPPLVRTDPKLIGDMQFCVKRYAARRNITLPDIDMSVSSGSFIGGKPTSKHNQRVVEAHIIERVYNLPVAAAYKFELAKTDWGRSWTVEQLGQALRGARIGIRKLMQQHKKPHRADNDPKLLAAMRKAVKQYAARRKIVLPSNIDLAQSSGAFVGYDRDERAALGTEESCRGEAELMNEVRKGM